MLLVELGLRGVVGTGRLGRGSSSTPQVSRPSAARPALRRAAGAPRRASAGSSRSRARGRRRAPAAADRLERPAPGQRGAVGQLLERERRGDRAPSAGPDRVRRDRGVPEGVAHHVEQDLVSRLALRCSVVNSSRWRRSASVGEVARELADRGRSRRAGPARAPCGSRASRWSSPTAAGRARSAGRRPLGRLAHRGVVLDAGVEVDDEPVGAVEPVGRLSHACSVITPWLARYTSVAASLATTC